MKKKILKPIIITLIVIVAVIMVAISVFSVYDRVKYRDFYKNSEKTFEIPGLWDGVIQQGFDYSEEYGVYIYSGYMKDGSASRIYAIHENGDYTYVSLLEADGSDCTEHVGGVAVSGDTVYVTASSRNQILTYKLGDVIKGGTAKACGQFDIGISPAYIYVSGNTLYTGEFYREGNYETPQDHRFTTPAGDQNTAIIEVYGLSDDGLLTSNEPKYVISTRGLVQGMALDKSGKLILSTSYGLAKSNIYVYNLDKVHNEEVVINGRTATVKYADSSALEYEFVAPPMSEELVYKDGKLLIMTESASTKYIFGKLTGANYVYAFDFDTEFSSATQGNSSSTQKPVNTPKS